MTLWLLLTVAVAVTVAAAAAVVFHEMRVGDGGVFGKREGTTPRPSPPGTENLLGVSPAHNSTDAVCEARNVGYPKYTLLVKCWGVFFSVSDVRVRVRVQGVTKCAPAENFGLSEGSALGDTVSHHYA